jgi:hypothetical protein
MRYISLSILTVGLCTSALADLVRIDFQGTISVSGFSSVSAGDKFSGSAYYSSPDVPYLTDPNFCGSPGACIVAFYHTPLAFDVTVDGSSITATNLSENVIQVQDSVTAGPNDRVDIFSNSVPLLLSGPLAVERSPAFDYLALDFAGPTSLFSSPQIPLVFPSLGQWTTQASIDFATYSSFGSPDRQFFGNINNLTSTVVPEPSSSLVAVFFVLCLGVARGTRVSKR